MALLVCVCPYYSNYSAALTYQSFNRVRACTEFKKKDLEYLISKVLNDVV